MSLKVCCILLLACIVAINAQAANPPKKETASDARIFLSTFTVILSTVTSTTTIASTTTCTTSTAALNTCSVGRRRRGLFYDDAENQGRSRRGLFYNDDEPEVNNAPVKRAAEPAEPAPKVTTDESKSVPLVVQSGFSLPEGFVTPSGTPRFKLAYGTSTITTTATSVSTRSLTATCASTTSFSLCAASGK